MLRITGQDQRVEEWLRPIPFPRNRAAANDQKDETPESVRLVEEALGMVQRDMDEMNRLIDGPLPFPRNTGDDDGPSAA